MPVGHAKPACKRGGKPIAVVWLASQGPHIYELSALRLAPAFTRGVGTAIHQAHRSRGKRLSNFESRHHPTPAVSPNASLRALMEKRGLRHKDIAAVLANKGSTTEIMRGG